MRLVVNVPTYNEKDNIEEVIKKILKESKNLPGVDLHVLISDSHSPDGTADIVKSISKVNPKVHYLDVKVRGIGVGLVKGHKFALDRLKADILGQMDGDLSHNPATIATMLEYINNGYTLVNGSRSMPGGKNLLGWHRRLFSAVMSLYCRLSWGTFNITEYANSYRMFTKDLFQKIDFSKVPWKSKTYIFQPAFIYAAMLAGAKIKEVPITFEDRKRGYSKAQIVGYILDVLKFGVKVRIQKSKTFIKFLMVGTASYFISATVLGLLYRGQIYSLKVFSSALFDFISTEKTKMFLAPVDPRLFFASIISTELSIIFNFFWHENWTFKSHSHSGSVIHRLIKFNSTSLASPVIQIVTIQIGAHAFSSYGEQIGLAIGVVIGLFVNYIVNVLWIWKQK